MNRHILAGLLSFLLLCAHDLEAQEVLTLDQAVQTALENNYQIRIRQYDVEISQMQVDPALVGRRPVIDLNGTYQFGWSDARIETLPIGPGPEGANVNELNGISNTVNVGPQLNLTLIDGKAGKYQLEQFSKLSAIASLQLRQTIEQTISAVTSAYLNIAREQSLMGITRQNIELSQERLARVTQDASYGNSSSLEELQVEVDLKTDSVTLRNQALIYENAKRDLLHLMGLKLYEDYVVEEDVLINSTLRSEALEQQFLSNNTLLKISDQNVALAELDIDLAKSAYRPRLSGFANVNYNYIQDDASFLLETRTFGPNIGVNLSIPILDGGARRIRKQSAEVRMDQRTLEKEELADALLQDLRNIYATYRNTLEQLRIEKSNLRSFERNLENIEDKFRLGLATNTDVRAAQLNLNAAQNRISNYQFTIKQAEIDLYLLSGQLIDE